MPTQEELLSKFGNAAKAGDERAARYFKQELMKMGYAPPGRAPAAAPEPESSIFKEDAQGESIDNGLPFDAVGRTGPGRVARSAASGINSALSGSLTAASEVSKAYGRVHEAFPMLPLPGSKEGADDIANALRGAATVHQDLASDLNPVADGVGALDSPEAFGHAAVNAGARMLPGMVTGNPVAGAAVIGSDVYGSAIQEGEAMGLEGQELQQRAMFMAGAEFLSEIGPLKVIFNPATKELSSRAVKTLKAAGLEGAQEVFTQILQMGYDDAKGHADFTLEEYMDGALEAGLLGATVGGGYASIMPSAQEKPDDPDGSDQPKPRTEPTVTPANTTPSPNDDVAEGIANAGALQPEPSALTDGDRSELSELGVNLDNLEESSNEEAQPYQQEPYGAPIERADSALTSGSVDGVQRESGERSDQVAVESGREPDQESGGRQSDGLVDERGDPQPGQEPQRSALAGSDQNQSPQPGGLQGQVDPQRPDVVEVDGEQRLMALTPLPSETPQLDPELANQVLFEAGEIDSEGRDVAEEFERNALAFIAADREASEGATSAAQPAIEPVPYTQSVVPDGDSVSPESSDAGAQTVEGESALASPTTEAKEQTEDRAEPASERSAGNALEGKPSKQAEIDAKAAAAATSPTNDRPEPTQAQKEAGNYKKGDAFSLNGMRIRIENPKGSERQGQTEDGDAWSNTMGAHYGDIKGTTGADGDALDVFVGDAVDTAENAVILNQYNEDGSFDEHKILAGFDSQEAAIKAHRDSYDDGFYPNVTPFEVSNDQLKEWIRNGDHRQPFEGAKAATDPAPEAAPEQDADSSPSETESVGSPQSQLLKRRNVSKALLDCVKGGK